MNAPLKHLRIPVRLAFAFLLLYGSAGRNAHLRAQSSPVGVSQPSSASAANQSTSSPGEPEINTQDVPL